MTHGRVPSRCRYDETGGVHSSFIPVLACPSCSAPLIARTSSEETTALQCTACGVSTSIVRGIWDALAGTPHRPLRTGAQLTNLIPLVARGYEPVWRRRSLSLLSGRSFPMAEELDELVNAVHPGPGAVFADVACSEGFYARRLAAAGASVVAVDHSTAFLRRLSRHRLGAVLAVRGLAQHLPFRTASLDGVVIGGSLNEIGDADAALAEARRVTRSGGLLFSMSLVAAGTTVGRLLQGIAKPSGIVFPTVEATVATFERAGWHVEHTALDRVVLRITATAA